MLHASGRRACRSQAGGDGCLINYLSQRCFNSTRTRCRYLRHSSYRGIKIRPAAVSAEAAPLVDWMQQQGCTVHGVDLIYERSDGQLFRELRANKDLVAGEVLLTVPLHCTLHYIDQQQHDDNSSRTHSSSSSSSSSPSSNESESTSSRAALRRLQAQVPASTNSKRGAWQFKVALEILYHLKQGTNSPLYPYIQTLPGIYPGIPGPQVAMLYPEAQLQEFQYGPLIADAGGQSHWWKTYSQDVLLKLPGTADDAFGGQTVTQEEMGWALSLAMSRAFGFKRLGGWALVPLVDMANHSLISNAEIRCDESGTVKMIANKSVTAGAPILLKYGNHDNANLLLSYGFVLQDNPADRFVLPLDLDLVLTAIYQFVGNDLPPTGSPIDGLKTWQKTTLQQLGLLSIANQQKPAAAAAAAAGADASDSHGRSSVNSSSSSSDGLDLAAKEAPGSASLLVSIGEDPPVSGALLAAVRVALATERSQVKGKSLEQLGDWNKPISAEHEALVMKALLGLCTVLYKSFPTTIQADRAALKKLQQQQQQQQGGSCTTQSQQMKVQRLEAAVQFRLGMKLLLEQSSKQMIVRLKALLH